MDLAGFKRRYPSDDTHATIVVTNHALPMGARYCTYEWQGDKRKPVFISHHLTTEIEKLPWPLKKIDDNYPFGCGEYMRTDVDLGLTALLWAIRRGAGQWAHWVNVRLIVTCAVWGLAEFDDFARPSWSDLHIVRRIKQQLKRPKQ